MKQFIDQDLLKKAIEDLELEMAAKKTEIANLRKQLKQMKEWLEDEEKTSEDEKV